MALYLFGCVRGAPGVTSTVVELASAWSSAADRSALVVEADPDGGVLAARHDLSANPSLTELSGAARLGLASEDLWRFAQRLPGGIPAVVAHPAAEQTQAAMRTAAPHLSLALAGLPDHDVLADVGRVRPGSPALPLAEHADLIVVVMRPTLEDVVAVTHRSVLLHTLGPVVLLFNGSGPYGAGEISRATGISVIGSRCAVPRRRRARVRHDNERAGLIRAIHAHRAPSTPSAVEVSS